MGPVLGTKGCGARGQAQQLLGAGGSLGWSRLGCRFFLKPEAAYCIEVPGVGPVGMPAQ